jgi:hypothetical protein
VPRCCRQFFIGRKRTSRNSGASFLFGLAPCVVCPARCIAAAAVRSYRTFSPLPASVKTRAVYFLWHFPSNGLEPALPDVIRHTALRSSDFPLPASTPFPVKDARSDRPVQLPTESLYGKSGLRASVIGLRLASTNTSSACYNARDAEHKSAPAIACDDKRKKQLYATLERNPTRCTEVARGGCHCLGRG